MDVRRRAGDNVNLIVFDNIQPIIWGTTIPFFVLCLTSCIVRLYTRVYVRPPFGTDDWFMLFGSIIWIGQQYIAWMWTILGGGLHVTDPRVKPEDLKKISTYLFVEEFYYLLLQLFIKMSFLFFYRRTLEATRNFRIAVLSTMVLVCLQTVGTWIFYALQCIPIQAYFHPEAYPDAVCIDSGLSYYLPSVANVFVDVVIYLLPIWPLWHMQTTLRRRLGLIAIFTLGGGTILVSTLRFIVLWQLANTKDVSYIFGSVTIVTSIEFAVAIFTANMPAMAAFYRSKISKTAHNSTGHYDYGSDPVGSKEIPKGISGSSQKRDKLSSHTGDGYLRTSSQEELYPMSRLSRKGEKDIRVDTEVVVKEENARTVPGNNMIMDF